MYRRSLLVFTIIVLWFSFAYASENDTPAEDTLRVYWLTPIEVTAERVDIGGAQFPTDRGDFARVLETAGFALVRRGAFFAHDIYADGFKRGDITVVIDGERYHSACPNRMDSPLTRVNPMEMKTIGLVKSSASLQSGLAGSVEFHREQPTNRRQVKSALSQTAGSATGSDIAAAFNTASHRLDIRYAAGDAYENADRDTYQDLYGYADDYTYKLAEASLRGVRRNWEYGGSFTYTENVQFPYLQMDERFNRVYSGFARYKKNKLYFNYTDHGMDNGMRISTGSMVTTAQNLTIGANGDHFDFYYRNWNADNNISTPMTTITNHLMPDIHVLAGSGLWTTDRAPFAFSAKLGLAHHLLGDDDRLSFYQALYPDADKTRWFVTGAVGGSVTRQVSKHWAVGSLVELASEPPGTEQLFISVRKPMGKEYWSGNPDLHQPLRSTLRASVSFDAIRASLFGSYVWNYVTLEKDAVGMQPYLTYANIDALLLGAGIHADWRYLDISAAYTWGENRSASEPLAEIAPFSITTALTSPTYKSLTAQVRHTYSDAQTRVSDALHESATGSWHRIDMTLAFESPLTRISLELENVTDELYTQHLSSLRSPFRSGVQVWEPGRTIRVNLSWNYISGSAPETR